MTTGRWHHSITLPSGQRVTADYREPIVRVILRAQAADPPELSDLAAILDWYRQNVQTVTECQEGRCAHVVI